MWNWMMPRIFGTFLRSRLGRCQTVGTVDYFDKVRLKPGPTLNTTGKEAASFPQEEKNETG
jgi:hypothetical protein